MRSESPFESSRRQVGELSRATLGWSLFLRQSSFITDEIQRSIETGFADRLFFSGAWIAAGERLLLAARPPVIAMARNGFAGGLAAVPGGAVLSSASALAVELPAAERAIALIQAVAESTRGAIRALLAAATNEWRRAPSRVELRRLTSSIQALIGLTERQAQLVERSRSTLISRGASREAADAAVARQAARMIELRADAIASRAVAETVNWARHQAWRRAVAAGLLPEGIMKQWRDQGDERVRSSHAAQSDAGPIPLDQVYPLHGVMHPPSPDFGCRCWDELSFP